MVAVPARVPFYRNWLAYHFPLDLDTNWLSFRKEKAAKAAALSSIHIVKAREPAHTILQSACRRQCACSCGSLRD